MTDISHEAVEALAYMHLREGNNYTSDMLYALFNAKERVEAERDEALNQLESARHSEECLKRRCEVLWTERDALKRLIKKDKTNE